MDISAPLNMDHGKSRLEQNGAKLEQTSVAIVFLKQEQIMTVAATDSWVKS
jgi:hypothetical protein